MGHAAAMQAFHLGTLNPKPNRIRRLTPQIFSVLVFRENGEPTGK